MPEETVRVGNREYQIACQPGEERFLQAAARLLDAETEAVAVQAGRLPENRALLMAGLMLADKSGGMEEQLRAKDDRIAELERQVADMRAAPERVEVQVIPDDVLEAMATLAARAEAVAEKAEDRATAS